MSMIGSASGASVVVIGGGVTGLSTAWWLAREGVDVTVVEAGIVGGEASGRNGGGCSHHYSPLFAEEQRLWPEMDERLGYPTEFQPNRIRIALDEKQFAQYGRAKTNAERQGYRCDVLDPQDVARLVPLSNGELLGAYYFHFGGHANPQRTVQAFAWALQDLGGRVLQHTKVNELRLEGGRVRSVVTNRGTIACDFVVIAAGPATHSLAAMLDINIPMVPSRVEMLVTEPLPLMPLGGVDGNGLYGRQTLRGNLAYGGGPHEWIGEDASTRSHSSTPLVRDIAGRIAQLLPKAAHAHVIRSWAGVVENTPDGRPVIERLSTPDNVVLATMSGVGFGLSPAVGHAIRDLVIDGVCSFADISTYALSRFDELEPDWAQLQGWQR